MREVNATTAYKPHPHSTRASEPNKLRASVASRCRAVRSEGYMPPYYHIEDFEDCLGDAYLKAQKFELAIKEYERVLGLNPNKALVRFHLAEALDGAGQPARA